ncbi:MAG: cupin domain-containing protein [Candidatus Planktophila sp.]|nr:cupin domain-containing protein [Candidatus Planktophila sp.]
MTSRADELIAYFGMKPLPVEGTYFINTYISDAKTASGGPAGTAGLGLYLREPVSASRAHVLEFDEVWHYYEGDPVALYEFHIDGTARTIILGRDIAAGQVVQHTIKAGVIQAGEVAPGGQWSLFACTMSPGFTASCFRGVSRNELHGKYAGYEEIIERMGVPDGHETDLPADYVNERFSKN